MRVIAGSAKGVRLARPARGTRPVSARAREGLFSSLGGLTVEARCLDLYAGTGALGIEALSRGAAACDFVDDSAGAIKVIRANLERTRFEGRARVFKAEAGRFLSRPVGPYDLALADPPYEASPEVLRMVFAQLTDVLAEGGTLVVSRSSKGPMDVIPVDFAAVRRLEYGDTVVLVCREEG